jgi:hypothetical protein
MTEEERAVVDFLLGAEFPGVESLREQARHAKVTGLCGCGCPWLDGVELVWYGEAPPLTFPDLSLFDSPQSG